MLSLILGGQKDARVDRTDSLFSSLGALLAELHAMRINSGHRLPRFDVSPPENRRLAWALDHKFI